MTWTVPEVTRVAGSLVAGEREMLEGYLAWQRTTLLHKCAGLTGEQLAGRTVPPSNLSLLGLLRHMAKVERIWFRERFAGEQVERLHDTADSKAADFAELDPARAAEDYARLVEECRLADAVVAGAKLDDTCTHDGEVLSLRLIYLHMITEYARHLGHADLLRERTDGVTGG
ncbi:MULTISPECIES: DinB family protein [Kitasatospora]|uniref:DinB family protein n=1 Tax=Kitasatospora cystarginea TaxID=58350 RepID=A0ABN3ET86_9ACTN